MRHSILMPIMIFMTRFYHNSIFFFRLAFAGNYFFRVLRAAFFLMSVVFVSSCEEGPTMIGNELLPGSDFVTISSTDTLSVWSYNMYNSSVPTGNPSFGYVGSIYDPYFGTTTTEFVSQLRLSNAWYFGPVTIDSVKMILHLMTAKGGSVDVAHFIRLSEIADEIYTDATYYSDTKPDTTDFEVTAQLPILRPDTINDISVSLPVSFGEYLTRDTTQLFYSNAKPDFRTFFKGLYFRMSAGSDPLIFAFSLINEISSGGGYNNYFVLYMHDTANVAQRYYFILDPLHANACYNRFTHDFTTAEPGKKIEHVNDTTIRDTLTYLQYLNGIYTKIVFPGLDGLKQKFANSKVSINKARISIPAYYDGDRYTVLTVPSALRLLYTDKDGVKHDVPDYNLDANSQFFDGTLHTVDSTYYFNIPTYIQLYLEDTKNEYLPELDVYQGSNGLQSVIFRANGSKIPVKFDLTYTEF